MKTRIPKFKGVADSLKMEMKLDCQFNPSRIYFAFILSGDTRSLTETGVELLGPNASFFVASE
jgi:hypothetical protein